VRIASNLTAGRDILIRSGGTGDFSQFRLRALGKVDVQIDDGLTAREGAIIAHGGAAKLSGDADRDGKGTISRNGVTVSERAQSAAVPRLRALVTSTDLADVLPPGEFGQVFVSVANGASVTYKGTVSVVVYATADGTLDASDRALGRVAKAVTLKPNAKTPLKVAVRLPADIAPGQYRLMAEILPYGSAPASFTPNAFADANVALGKVFTVRPGTPAVAAAEQPSLAGRVSSSFDGKALKAGKKGKVKVNVTNVGASTARGPENITVYASTTGSLDGAVRLASVSGGNVSLKPNKSKSFTAKVTLPELLDAGQYMLIAVIDGDAAGDGTTPDAGGGTSGGTARSVVVTTDRPFELRAAA
jgi:hypothetical protein